MSDKALEGAAEHRQAESEERLRLATELADVGLWDVDPVNGTLYWTPRVRAMFGVAPEAAISMPDFWAGLHPDDREPTRAAANAATDPEKRALFDVEYRVIGKSDGVMRWLASKGRGLFDASGRCVRVMGASIDITERKRQEEVQKRLLDELNHRVKNTLATVQSFALQSLRNAPSVADGRAALESRLIALARAHDILVRQRWESASVHEVVESALASYATDDPARLLWKGPEIRLQPRATLAISMALHELATNAVKYGALSNGAGRIGVHWESDPRSFALRWTETDGPAVVTPRRRGFGSRLIEQGLAHDLGGEARLDFAQGGVVCTIAAPLAEVADPAGRAPDQAT